MRIETVNIDSLTPYEKNAKLHPRDQIEQIKKSIEMYGNNDPIAVWGEKNVIVEGHGRYTALRELGYKTADIIRLDHLTDEQRREYMLVHNQTTMNSGWDIDLLAGELEGLDFDGFDFGFDLGLGLDDEDEQREIIEDEVPEEAPSVCKLGDLWKLGENLLICGDSTDTKVVGRLMNGEKADMVFTDPPWNINYGAVQKGNAMGYKPRTIKNDHMETDEFKDFMFRSFKSMNEASKPWCMIYVVMSEQEWGNMMLTLAENEYHWSSTIIWNKDQFVLSRKDYHTKYEPIWYGWKEGESRLCPLQDRKQCDVWDFDRPKKSDEHPTMKPVGLVAKAITNSSKKGNVVLDLFGGSGTTLIASEQTNRRCRMVELDPHYCDVIIKRWENLTGQTAELIKD